LDCPTNAFSIEYYPAFALSDSAFQTSKIGSDILSPFNLAVTFSSVLTRRFFMGVGAGLSSEGQVNAFIDFKYASSLRYIGPMFSFQTGSYVGIEKHEFIPYVSTGIGIRQRIFNWNFLDFHIQDQIRFNSGGRENTGRKSTHYMLISFRFTILLIQNHVR